MSACEAAVAILKQTQYAVLATTDQDGQPWNSPLFVVYDAELSLYWASSSDSQHSRNVAANPRVFVVLFDSGAAWGTGQGLYIQAEVALVTAQEEVAKVQVLRAVRVPAGDKSQDTARHFYKATPRQIWVNDAELGANGRFVKDIRTPVSLDELRQRLGS